MNELLMIIRIQLSFPSLHYTTNQRNLLEKLTMTEEIAHHPTDSILIQQREGSDTIQHPLHNDLSDDYFRLDISPKGNYLISLTLRKVCTVYDMASTQQIEDFFLKDVIHTIVSQDDRLLSAQTKNGKLKIFEFSQNDQKKNLELVADHQFSEDSLGWAAWTLSNKWLIFVQNKKFHSISRQKLESEAVQIPSVDDYSQCQPYYLISDKSHNNLIYTSSQTGVICSFKLLFKPIFSQQSEESDVTIQLLSRKKLWDKPTIVSDLKQSQNHILISTARVSTGFGQYSYFQYRLKKQNFEDNHSIELHSNSLLPGSMIQSQPVGDYLLSFVKGQELLYINSIQNLNQATDQKVLTFPFSLQGIAYDSKRQQLALGTTGQANEDLIVFMDFGFDCSRVPNSSSTDNRENMNPELEPQCQCEFDNLKFSFDQASCALNTSELFNCDSSNKSTLGRRLCLPSCANIQKSIGGQMFINQNAEEQTFLQCACIPGHFWVQNQRACLTLNEALQSVSQPADNPPQETIQEPIFVKPIEPSPIENQGSEEQSSESHLGTVLIILFIILLAVAIVLLVLRLLKRKYPEKYQSCLKKLIVFKREAQDEEEMSENKNKSSKQNTEKQSNPELQQPKAEVSKKLYNFQRKGPEVSEEKNSNLDEISDEISSLDTPPIVSENLDDEIVTDLGSQRHLH